MPVISLDVGVKNRIAHPFSRQLSNKATDYRGYALEDTRLLKVEKEEFSLDGGTRHGEKRISVCEAHHVPEDREV